MLHLTPAPTPDPGLSELFDLGQQLTPGSWAQTCVLATRGVVLPVMALLVTLLISWPSTMILLQIHNSIWWFSTDACAIVRLLRFYLFYALTTVINSFTFFFLKDGIKRDIMSGKQCYIIFEVLMPHSIQSIQSIFDLMLKLWHLISIVPANHQHVTAVRNFSSQIFQELVNQRNKSQELNPLLGISCLPFHRIWRTVKIGQIRAMVD